MRTGANVLRTVVVLSILTLQAACQDEVPLSTASLTRVEGGLPSRGALRRGHERVSVTERTNARLLAQVLASALEDPEVRRDLFQAFAGSQVKEGKLHLASFIRGRGETLLRGAAERGGKNANEVAAALRAVRDLEIYLPVRWHRQKWTGSSAPVVVLALTEEESPEAVDALGNQTLLSREFAPNDEVIVLAPVESNFAEQIALNERGKAETECSWTGFDSLESAIHRCAQRGRPTVGNYTFSDAKGAYLTEVRLAYNVCGGECWAWGDPEYEMHVYAHNSGDGKMKYIQCVSADENATGNPGVRTSAYRYDQNGRQ